MGISLETQEWFQEYREKWKEDAKPLVKKMKGLVKPSLYRKIEDVVLLIGEDGRRGEYFNQLRVVCTRVQVAAPCASGLSWVLVASNQMPRATLVPVSAAILSSMPIVEVDRSNRLSS